MKRNERISTKKKKITWRKKQQVLYSKETKFLLRAILLLPIMRLFLILLAISDLFTTETKSSFNTDHRSHKNNLLRIGFALLFILAFGIWATDLPFNEWLSCSQ